MKEIYLFILCTIICSVCFFGCGTDSPETSEVSDTVVSEVSDTVADDTNTEPDGLPPGPDPRETRVSFSIGSGSLSSSNHGMKISVGLPYGVTTSPNHRVKLGNGSARSTH